jgi:hypothetical protein
MVNGMGSGIGGDLLLSLIVGFGFLALIMVVGFYLLIKAINDLRNSITRIDSRFEGVEKRVEDIARQLEEV